MTPRHSRALRALGAALAISLAGCAAPLGAPADSGRTTTQTAAVAPQARQILPLSATATAVAPIEAPTPTPETGAPLGPPLGPALAPTASPVAPAMPTLPVPPRPPLDAGSQAALNALVATATAQAVSAASTAQALPVLDIIIKDFAFAPATFTVKPGTTIVWRNFDRVQHQVAGGEFDSGRINGGWHWAQVIGKPGRYQFICTFHPAMRAEITVSPDDTRPLHLGS